MTGWIILGSVLVLLVLLCQVRLGVEGSYTPEGGAVCPSSGAPALSAVAPEKAHKEAQAKTPKSKKSKTRQGEKAPKAGIV